MLTPEQAKEDLGKLAPRLGSPTAAERALLLEMRADKARLAGNDEVSRMYGRESALAALEAAERHSGEIAVTHVVQHKVADSEQAFADASQPMPAEDAQANRTV